MGTKSLGFTLIELIITCCLIALIAGIAMSSFSFFQRTVMRSEIDALHAACMALQQTALASNTTYILEFDECNNCYTFQGQHVQLPRNVCFGVAPGVKGPPADPHAEITKAITFQNSRITFTPQGIIQPGTVYITDSDKHIMYALSCGVAQVSYLRKYRYDGKWHLINT